MTSRTGHVMAAVALQPLDERLREAQLALGGRVDLVDGTSTTTSSEPPAATVVSSDDNVRVLLAH